MGSHYGLTALERLTLEEVGKLKSSANGKGHLYRLVAEKLHVSEDSVKNRLSRIRKRYDKAERFAEDYREFRRKVNSPGWRIL